MDPWLKKKKTSWWSTFYWKILRTQMSKCNDSQTLIHPQWGQLKSSNNSSMWVPSSKPRWKITNYDPSKTNSSENYTSQYKLKAAQTNKKNERFRFRNFKRIKFLKQTRIKTPKCEILHSTEKMIRCRNVEKKKKRNQARDQKLINSSKLIEFDIKTNLKWSNPVEITRTPATAAADRSY